MADVKVATSGATNAADEVRGGTYEPLSYLEGLLGSLNGYEGGGIGTGITSLVVAVEST